MYNILNIKFIIIIFILILIYNQINNIKYLKINKIYMLQGDDNGKLEFMYKPFIISSSKILKDDINEIDYKINYNYNTIKPNNILLWIGPCKIPDFVSLIKKNIYTIYYNTEPDTNNFFSNEIWTYSKYLFHKYVKVNNEQIIKFVPISCEENVPFVPYHLKNDSIKLIFLGKISYRNEKSKIILSSSFMKDNLEEIYNVWNDKDYNNMISSKANIFLNLTKNGTIALPSARINKLLSHKCIIISEHTNEIDEELYKGIIYFCNINEIENIYKNLINKSNVELQKEANDKYTKFYNIFNYKNAVNLILVK